MSATKCGQCGLMNFAGTAECRRCGAQFHGQVLVVSEVEGEDDRRPKRKRRILKSAIRVIALAGFLIFLWYASLIGTSEPVLLDQKKVVENAISVLERRGFDKEVFMLRHMVSFRATDNWWNQKVGHVDAFASTNFPFQVMTLYSPFFDQTKDDVERAFILLHESYHLYGHGEPEAVAGAWKYKKKLGWTKDLYGSTEVWTNAREATREFAPELLECGPEHNLDCAE